MSFDAELALKITKAFENIRSYKDGDEIRLANIIKGISDLGENISNNEVYQALMNAEMPDVAEEYIRISN